VFELLKLLGGWAWIVLLITIGIIVFIILNFKKQNKQVELTEIKLPGVTAKISPIPVRRIAFITQPKDASGMPASLADIIVRIYDDNNKPLGGRQVIVELHSFSGTDYLRGILNRLSDETGTVVFSGLKISRSGQYELIAKSEGQLIISAPFEITPLPVRRIAFITQPKDASGRPASLADIIVRIYDDNNKPLGGRQVIVELNSFSGTDYLRGILNRLSDETGTVVFSGLKILRSGQYELIAKSEGQLIISAPFEITPPGLDTNFSDKPFNSPEYKIALSRKLALSKAEDELKMDKEEI